MAVKTLQSLAGQQATSKLAVDTSWFSNYGSLSGNYITVSSIDATASLTTILSLTGKFEIVILKVSSATANDITDWKLTIDGVVVHNETSLTVNQTSVSVYGELDGDNGPMGIRCDSTLLLQLKTDADADMILYYAVRPIL